MGLVFLRHACSRYLAVKDDIEVNLPKRGGQSRALTKEDFSQKSAIFLQSEAQFDDPIAPSRTPHRSPRSSARGVGWRGNFSVNQAEIRAWHIRLSLIRDTKCVELRRWSDSGA
jgi:hypothetical protein